MNKFKPASKLRILAIISCALIVIGLVFGTVLHFVGNGFFNYDGEYSSYKSISVTYNVVEIAGSDKDVDLEAICEDAFESAGVKFYAKTADPSAAGGKIEYRFTSSTENAALESAQKQINAKIKESLASLDMNVLATRAELHVKEAVLGGGRAVSMAAVVLATMVVVHLIYTMIRYRFSAAFAAIAVDLHNLALYAALLALCRVPVSSTVMVFGVILTLATAIGVTFMLERIKRNAKEGDKLSVEDLTNLGAAQTVKANVALPAFLAIVAALLFAVMAISTMSILAVLTPAILAIVAFVVTIYGTVLCAPALYCTIKNIGNKISEKPSQKKGN